MSDIRLNDTDITLIERLSQGRNVPANLAEEIGVSRQYVQQRLKRMEEHEVVRNIGRGVYELVEDPRDD
ncbi:winged helix-turn-helix domain-containing protein [Salinigranum rubrum]|uniref:Winged helix-turn-helix domain-containing protein n=1 Tax=Salinigranum rubrum TaxID=755307 RepID=A0A2I8VN53_9EURY|nr:winged helix-turn-helix transcriptional regulator [Salinigranum rubrum]AUV82519.1 winged helix-turn-helix domain-containing protein [Salinigranum rubrum]